MYRACSNTNFLRLFSTIQMLDKSSIYLFPETIQTNPFLFMGKAVQVSPASFNLNGYKLYCLIDKLNLAETPFTVVAVRSVKSSTTFYQYNFPHGAPDFKELGFSLISTPNGQVLFMTNENFIKETAKSRYLSIKTGAWATVSRQFYELTAYYHLDIIPQLSLTLFKNPNEIEKYSDIFHKLYDVKGVQTVSLYSLFNDLSALLVFFGFMKQRKQGSDTFYSFAVLREPFRKFTDTCFDKMFLSDCAVTPAAVKQLRALFKFVRLSLNKLGYESNQSEDIYYNTNLALNRFQRDNNIKDTYCSKQVIRCLLTQVLSLAEDPSVALQGTGINMMIDSSEGHQFGVIDTSNLDDVAKRFATGVSRAVSQLTSPAVCITEVEKEMISLSKQASSGVRQVNEVSQLIGEKMNEVRRIALDVKEESDKALKRADTAEKSLISLESISDTIEKKMESVKAKLAYEMKVSNTLVIILLLLIAIFIWQGFHSETIEDMIKHKIPKETAQ